MTKIKYLEKMRVLHIASELTPIAKAGGLGDIVGFLPKELAREYHQDVKIVMPKYKSIDLETFPAELIMKDVRFKGPNGEYQKVSIWKTVVPETIISVYLVDSPKVFNGEGVYDHRSRSAATEPFIFLAKIALELMKALDWGPDIIHAHDAMTVMAIKWLRTIYKNDPFFRNTATVLTIHNMAYQVRLPNKEIKNLGLKRKDFQETRKMLKNKKSVNMLAEGIYNADMINTVSPNYAREVMTKRYGAGMQKILKKNKKRFTGILNGIEYFYFDPRNNEDTPVKYWIDTLDKKAENKLYLQKKLGLTESPDLPLICVISRLTEQKGLSLVEDVLNNLVDMGAQFVVLGSGEDRIEKIFVKAEKKYPEDIAAEMEFDAKFSQAIYAGADMILMPSRFEPCGLSQIIAMRFGTIPIVRKTGGLADTVRDGYTGFVFCHYDKDAFLWAIRRAVDVYYNQKDHWRKMQIQAMKKDFSWKASAKKYLWLYKKAISNRKKRLEEENDE